MRKLTAATAAAIASVIVISAPNGRGALAQSATIELQATVSAGDTTLRRVCIDSAPVRFRRPLRHGRVANCAKKAFNAAGCVT